MKIRPVFFYVVPNPTITYQVNDGRAEIIGLAGGRGGSVRLSGSSISLVGAGLLRLGIGDIKITGKNNDNIVWKNVPNAKSIASVLIS